MHRTHDSSGEHASQVPGTVGMNVVEGRGVVDAGVGSGPAQQNSPTHWPVVHVPVVEQSPTTLVTLPPHGVATQPHILRGRGGVIGRCERVSESWVDARAGASE